MNSSIALALRWSNGGKFTHVLYEEIETEPAVNGGNGGQICSRFICSSTQRRDSFARSGAIPWRRENPHVVSVAGDDGSLEASEALSGKRCSSELSERERFVSTRGVHKARSAVG